MWNRCVIGGVAFVACCAVWIGVATESHAQDREKGKACCDTVVQASEARFTYHRAGTETAVFDTHTGRLYKTNTQDTLREIDPIVGVVKIRKLEVRDERGGSVIRQSPGGR